MGVELIGLCYFVFKVWDVVKEKVCLESMGVEVEKICVDFYMGKVFIFFKDFDGVLFEFYSID